MAFNIKKFLGKDNSDEYLEIDLESIQQKDEKVIVKPFVLKSFDAVNDILEALRTGFTIAVIDIRPLKSKDIIELKRAVSKIKKTVDALEGEIAGFGEGVVIATPKFAQIHKPVEKKKEKADFIGQPGLM